MKRRFMPVLAVVLGAALVLPVSASGVREHIHELGMSVETPEGCALMRRQSSSGDAAMAALGITDEQISARMSDDELIASLCLPDGGYMDLYALRTPDAEDYSELDDDIPPDGDAPDGAEAVKHGSYTYLKYPEGGAQVFQTVENGLSCRFVLVPAGGEQSGLQLGLAESFLDTVRFDGDFDSRCAAAPYIYSDPLTGASLRVPSGLDIVGESAGAYRSSAAFRFRERPDTLFIYSAEDGGAFAPKTRDELASLTAAEAAAEIGCAEDELGTVSCGGSEYFRGEAYYSGAAYGLSTLERTTVLLRRDYGVTYKLMYMGGAGDEGFAEFERLAAEVSYPSHSDLAALLPDASQIAPPESGVYAAYMTTPEIILSFLRPLLPRLGLALALVLLPSLLLRFAIVRRRLAALWAMAAAVAFLAVDGLALYLLDGMPVSAFGTVAAAAGFALLISGRAAKKKPDAPIPDAPIPEEPIPDERVGWYSPTGAAEEPMRGSQLEDTWYSAASH